MKSTHIFLLFVAFGFVGIRIADARPIHFACRAQFGDSSSSEATQTRHILQFFLTGHSLRNSQMDSLLLHFSIQQQNVGSPYGFGNAPGDDSLMAQFLRRCRRLANADIRYLKFFLGLNNLAWNNAELGETIGDGLSKILLFNPKLIKRNWDSLSDTLRQSAIRSLRLDDCGYCSPEERANAKYLRSQLSKLK
jgi:hypothetical protein